MHEPLTDHHLSDLDLVQRCLEGDAVSIHTLRERYAGYLHSVLKTWGADPTGATDLIQDFWTDCIAGAPSRPPLFTRFDGVLALRPWLRAVLLNRWISLRRHRDVENRAATEIRLRAFSLRNSAQDPALMELLREVVRGAMAQCDDISFVLLQFVHMDGLTRREIALLWGCHESKIGRLLVAAAEEIQRATLQRLAQIDPALQVTWEDFLELCREAPLLKDD